MPNSRFTLLLTRCSCHCTTTMRTMRTLSDTMEERFFHTCQVDDPRICCTMPNTKRTPDIAVVLIPNSCKTHLKVPVFIFEVIGKKNQLGNYEQQYPGYTAAAQALAFQPDTYYGEVSRNIVTIHHFQREPSVGTIKVTQEEYPYACANFKAVMEKLTKNLVKMFLHQFVNMTWLNLETSKIMKLDFITEKDGMKIQCEKHCWHFSDCKYIGQMSSNHSFQC